MNRRDLLKALGVMGASLTVPQMMGRNAGAAVSQRELRNARAIVAGEINFVKPTSLPTVINIFLYGGPSELAGNLTNIDRINFDSQNKYTTVRGDILTDSVFSNNSVTGQITANKFWANAGGLIMEDLLAPAATIVPGTPQMSVIRTINRVVDDNKAHRESIFSAQTGGVATMESPGMGTVLAAILRAKIPEYDSQDSNLILPFVSFEGDTVLYDQGDINDLPLPLRSVSLDNGFNNPYRRQKLSAIAQNGLRNCLVNGTLLDCNVALENLASANAATAGKFDRLTKSLIKRRELDAYFTSGALSAPAGKVPATVIDGTLATGSIVTGSTVSQGTSNFTGSFGAALRAAVVLALGNQDVPGSRIGTRFITIGGGLGGWDDHDNSIQKYEQRMTDVMSNIRTALRLLSTGTATNGVLDGNARNDVIINMYGEFGRNVNLNGSMGWDHGNNMNLYTFGGSAIPGRVLGQVVGTTKVIGTPGQNRLFTSPADGSVQWEPFSIAATVYRQFGVQNPEVITKDPTIPGAANGFGSIPGLG